MIPVHSLRKSAASGFSLLELMVVIVIVGILMAYLLSSGAGAMKSAQVSETNTRLQQLATMVNEYMQINAVYPNDRLPSGVNNGDVNSQAEALFLELFSTEYSGSRPNQEWLINSDGDTYSKALTILPERQLFEIADAWGNPILYFESLHYDSPATVMAGMDGIYEEQSTEAARSDKTGAHLNPNGFQLISAGEDGLFGTEDDLIKP